jgi:hypothetical protein
MRRFLFCAAAILLASAPLFAQQDAAAPARGVDPVKPVVLSLSDKNPFACAVSSPPNLSTRDFASGITVTISAFATVRVNAAGKIEEVLLVHDPIPTLEPQQRESFKKWEFVPPRKGGAASAFAWATLRLDLKVEYSKPQITRATFVAISDAEPIPVPISTRWDESWAEGAPMLADLQGADGAEALDTPMMPKKTKWYADRFKAPFQAKVWIEVGSAGKATRIVPVELKDAALLPYLQNSIARWNFAPARNETGPVACWGVLDLAGTVSYDIDLVKTASLKKSIGPAAPAR